jgi:hypothetical protein
MRKTTLVVGLAAVLAAPAALAEDLTKELSLSPKDPKYNSAACKSLRVQARNYNDSIYNQSPGTYAIVAVAPGGTVGFMALQHRKRELFKARVEQACMSNPPDRTYLDPAAPGSKN